MEQEIKPELAEAQKPDTKIDSEIELKAAQIKADNQGLGRKVLVTFAAMVLVAAMPIVAHFLPVVERLYPEACSSLVLLTLTLTGGNVAATLVERKYAPKA